MFKFEFDPQKVSHFECFCYFVFNTITLFPDHFNILIPDGNDGNAGNQGGNAENGSANAGIRVGMWGKGVG